MRDVRQKHEDSLRGFGFALTAYLLWGFLPLFMKQVAHIAPAEVIAHRVIWSVPIALAVLWSLGQLGGLRSVLGQPRRLPDGSVEFISTRPGRIDKAVELTYMETADKKTMASRILEDYPAEHAKMLEFIDKFADLQETPAQFQERCGQIALACFWKEKQELAAAALALTRTAQDSDPEIGVYALPDETESDLVLSKF